MKLAADEPGMRREFDDLDQLAIRRESAESQAVLDEHVTILVCDFVPVTMPFGYFLFTIHR